MIFSVFGYQTISGIVDIINEFWTYPVVTATDIIYQQEVKERFCKRSDTLFKSLLFLLAGEVSWLAVEALSPCQK